MCCDLQLLDCYRIAGIKTIRIVAGLTAIFYFSAQLELSRMEAKEKVVVKGVFPKQDSEAAGDGSRGGLVLGRLVTVLQLNPAFGKRQKCNQYKSSHRTSLVLDGKTLL